MKSESPLRKKSFELSVKVVRLCKKVSDDQKEFILTRQLVRSATNPGAMLREAQNAESKADFIHKLKIAHKEISESQYWLELMLETQMINKTEFEDVHNLMIEIEKMLSSAILTLKKKL